MGHLGIKFWGTRGLVSSPSPDVAKYGGNTTCLEIIGAHNTDDEISIVDTGFGACKLGEKLMQAAFASGRSLTINIFYTHFHWDHTQGLPFFHPIYLPDTKIKIYSPVAPALTKENLDILFDGSYSPFSGIDSMPSQIEFVQLKQNDKIGNLAVEFAPVDHGRELTNQLVLPTYAYKFSINSSSSVGILTDHEARPSHCNQALIELMQKVDILIHDGQFTDAEYKSHVGWGHSSLSQALDNILACKAKLGILTHHAPGRSDAEIDLLQKNNRNIKKYKNLTFGFAEEDRVYLVESSKKLAKQAS
ncbi:MAG: MBL fold metallo-hydrolase [Oligoflexales bacterium]|nr:MBL fold metallo-hydrolase [Oligoflexales bacterium]